jgi:hypothetical protein
MTLTLSPVAWLDWGEVQDDNTTIIMDRVLDMESPQLVVFNGDLITGDDTFLENSTHYIDRIVKPLVLRGLPWASTYGNHDGQYNLSGQDLLARERRWPNAKTTQMVFDDGDDEIGITNYYLPVYGSKCTSTQYTSCNPVLLLWFFDSRGGWAFQQETTPGTLIPRKNWVDQKVVDWFTTTSSHLSQLHNKTLPSLLFVHQPTTASLVIQTHQNVHPNHQPGINDDVPLAAQASGWCPDNTPSETCAYGGQDIPFMEALASTPGIIAVFSGHDHGDTWCYKWDNKLRGMAAESGRVHLCFGQHSGYGGYGTWARGARQVLVTEEMLEGFEAETWIRLERGEVVGWVALNESFGEDWYEATVDMHSRGPDDGYFFERELGDEEGE